MFLLPLQKDHPVDLHRVLLLLGQSLTEELFLFLCKLWVKQVSVIWFGPLAELCAADGYELGRGQEHSGR